MEIVARQTSRQGRGKAEAVLVLPRLPRSEESASRHTSMNIFEARTILV